MATKELIISTSNKYNDFCEASNEHLAGFFKNAAFNAGVGSSETFRIRCRETGKQTVKTINGVSVNSESDFKKVASAVLNKVI